jgi:DNA primase
MTVPPTRLIAIHQAAAEHYTRNLRGPEGEGPRDYLAQRGLEPVLKDRAWCIGYALPRWSELRDHLRRKGFDDEEISASGLVHSTRLGTLVDRFRDRNVFGLRNHHQSELVGFIGRCPPRASSAVPKYLNSPRTEIFEKSCVLFGFAEQYRELAYSATPVVVEGPMDVLAVRQLHGNYAAVSPCGTRLTGQQAGSLSTTCASRRVLLANDSDVAGSEGMRRAYGQLSYGFPLVLAATFPRGQDPASVAAQDPLVLNRALSKARPALDLIVDQAIEPYLARLDNAEARVCALHSATQAIAHLRARDVSSQVARISERLDFATGTVTQDLADAVTDLKVRPQVRWRAAFPQLTRPSSIAEPHQKCSRPSRRELS